MSTIRDQILDAVVTALNTNRPSNVPDARRRRFSAIEADSLPVMDVAPLHEGAQRIGGKYQGPITKRTLRVAVRSWAGGEAPEIAADSMIAWATKALVGSNLGGLAIGIEEIETEWQGAIMDSVYGVAEQRFAIEYATKYNDQEAAS